MEYKATGGFGISYGDWQKSKKNQRIYKFWMEELIKTAYMYYKSSPTAVKNEAEKFFTAIDCDNDGKVGLHEFLGFMWDEGHEKMGEPQFFESLNRSGTGALDFIEVMTLYYIIKSGRPFCHGCSDFIPGMYFTCLNCYQNRKNAISLCPVCFDNREYTHEHFEFLDNFALLEIMRIQGFATHSEQQHQHQGQPTSSVNHSELSASTSQAVVPFQPHHPGQKWSIALKALDLAVSAAKIASIWATCTIM